VLDLEARLQSPAFHAACPALGSEVKVMAVRRRERAHLTIAAAMLDALVGDRRVYDEARASVLEVARSMTAASGFEPHVAVSTFDDVPLALRARSHTGTYRDVVARSRSGIDGLRAYPGSVSRSAAGSQPDPAQFRTKDVDATLASGTFARWSSLLDI
jgi:hypothetical protein